MELTPNEELAQRIAEKLVAERLIRPGDEKEVLTKLKNGRASIGDWKVWAEKVIENRETGDADSAEN